MARHREHREHLTEEEWRDLPITVDRFDMARALVCSPRWVADHAEELGGRKICGRWVFSKRELAKILGIEE